MKVFPIFQGTLILEKILVFSQEKAVLVVWKMKTLKNSLYFRKQNFSGGTSEVPKTKISYTFKSYEYIFLKTLLNNSFHLFYKLNQTILLIYKKL